MSDPKTRSRAFGNALSEGGRVKWTTVANQHTDPSTWPTLVGPALSSIRGDQTTISEGHLWAGRPTSQLYDVGGDFFTSKRYVVEKDLGFWHDMRTTFLGFPTSVDGTILPDFAAVNPNPGNELFPPEFYSSDSELHERGATAIARCNPRRSVANMAQTLGELTKDGLPLPVVRSFEKRAKIAKAAGDEFLNAAFGWLPLVDDVNSFAKFADKYASVLTQYERDSGKVVRRRYSFPTEESTEIFGPVPARLLVDGGRHAFLDGGPMGQISCRRVKTRDIWFSGSFTYYLPPHIKGRDGVVDRAALARELIGLKLDPELLWNLAPWTWAIDWFSNAGDYASNITDFANNGLVMHYGYVMEHTKTTDTYYHEGPSGLIVQQGHRTISFVTETKRRLSASPYGFGVSLDSLSNFQKAVVTALGISKLS